MAGFFIWLRQIYQPILCVCLRECLRVSGCVCVCTVKILDRNLCVCVFVCVHVCTVKIFSPIWPKKNFWLKITFWTFWPFLGLENNFLPYFGHFLINLAEISSRLKTTFGTLFRPRKQLLAIFRPFLDQLGRNFFLGLKPLLGPVLGLENNFWPYFGHFGPIGTKKFFGPKTTFLTHFRPRKQLLVIFWPFLDRLGQKNFLGLKPLFWPVLGIEKNFWS